MRVETLVEGLPGRCSIRRLFVSKDGGVSRPGGDKKDEGEQPTVNLVPLGLISIVLLRFRRAVGPGEDGLKIRREEIDFVPEFSLPFAKTRLPRDGPNGVQNAVDPGAMIPPSLKARVTLSSAVRFSAHVRRPESLKMVRAPNKDTVQGYTVVGVVQVAAP